MYSIHFDHERNLLDIAWGALFAPEDVESYARALRAEFVKHGFTSGYRLRMDMSRSAVQHQDALATFREQFRDFPKASRIAIVTPSAIARLQVLREMKQSYLRIFAKPDEALGWLMEPDLESVSA